tara:strand:- start:1651 stop:3102 length:1452 start_codon:yes stop_codon:yes gene_type:complete
VTDFSKLTISSAIKGLKKKDFTSLELTKFFIDKIQDKIELNCFITNTFEIALKMAKNADHRIMSKKNRILEGIPIGMKDLFCTNGVKTTAGSKILENFVPFYESTVSKNLWDSGAVMLGKTNMDEFAMGSANTTSFFGNVLNPLTPKSDDNKRLVPGGSSGGSASAVASGLCLAATGSDTGGSIRQPASFCGLVGLKPTYGRCSRFGMIAFASSLDQAGPIAKNVEDSALMLQCMASSDEKDSTSSYREIPNFLDFKKYNIKGKKIGIPKEYSIEGLNDEIQNVWKDGITWFKSEGADIVEISLPNTEFALPTYYIIAPAEASANLAKYDGVRYGFRSSEQDINSLYKKTRGIGFGKEVKRRLMIGTYVLSAGYYDAYYLKALKVRKLIANDFEQAFKSCDLILTPTTPNVAFPIGEKQTDPIEMYLNDVLTVPASLAGLPAISVSSGLNNEMLPIGLQIIGKPFDEVSVLGAASLIERSRGF